MSYRVATYRRGIRHKSSSQGCLKQELPNRLDPNFGKQPVIPSITLDGGDETCQDKESCAPLSLARTDHMWRGVYTAVWTAVIVCCCTDKLNHYNALSHFPACYTFTPFTCMPEAASLQQLPDQLLCFFSINSPWELTGDFPCPVAASLTTTH